MVLETIDIINGLLSLTYLIIAIIAGIKIGLVYFKTKKTEYLLVGILSVLITEPWWPSAFSFVIIFTGINENGLLYHPEIYFILGNILIPLSITIWTSIITDFFWKDKQKIYVLISIIYGIIFEVIFFYYLISDISMIGVMLSPVDSEYAIFIVINLVFVVVYTAITGFIFAYMTMRSRSPEIKLKGKFLYVAFSLFIVGSVLDGALSFQTTWLIFARLILMACAFFLYSGFILPSFLKKLFLKSDDDKSKNFSNE